ncbi:hypothetical protein [Streptomyces sp. GbtcB6]|nr:hypothetical protein [Streptomyces sp. GbtcB6]
MARPRVALRVAADAVARATRAQSATVPQIWVHGIEHLAGRVRALDAA